jgi:hypothetical protein
MSANFDSLDDDPPAAPAAPAAAKPGDFWRQGHKRPWWQWNVITLFVALFLLVWIREFGRLSQGVTWVTCVALIGAWVLVPAIIESLRQADGGQGLRALAYLGSLGILVGIMAFAGIHVGVFSVAAVLLMAIAVRAGHD